MVQPTEIWEVVLNALIAEEGVTAEEAGMRGNAGLIEKNEGRGTEVARQNLLFWKQKALVQGLSDRMLLVSYATSCQAAYPRVK